MLESQYLFAYGTLRSSEPESQQFGPKRISTDPGRVAGELYILEEGYPILLVPPETILTHPSFNWVKDWQRARQALKRNAADPVLSPPFVEGELIETPLEAGALQEPDRWEGYTVGSDSVYQRFAVPAIRNDGEIIATWVYGCTESPDGAKPFGGRQWIRR